MSLDPFLLLGLVSVTVTTSRPSSGSVSVTVNVGGVGGPTRPDAGAAAVLSVPGVRQRVPAIPAVVDAWDGSSLLSLWRYTVSRQGRDALPIQEQQKRGKQVSVMKMPETVFFAVIRFVFFFHLICSLHSIDFFGSSTSLFILFVLIRIPFFLLAYFLYFIYFTFFFHLTD